MDLEALQKATARLHMKLQDSGDGVGCSWVLEDRLRYKTMHREQDLALFQDTWAAAKHYHLDDDDNNVVGGALATKHYADTDSKTKKKYLRVTKVHRSAWEAELQAMEPHFENPDADEGARLAMEACNVLLDKMEKVLPKYKGYTLVDVTPKCRQGQQEWEDEENGGSRVTIHILYWTLYRLATCKQQLGDYEGVIKYANRALSLFPPLAKDSVPSPYELVCFLYKAKAHAQTKNYQTALDEYRAVMAATRLLMYKKDLAGTDGLAFLMKKCDKAIIEIVRYAVLCKMDKLTPRPYFSVEELNALEKELGVGIFGKTEYKCRGCDKLRTSVKLSLCARCKRVWYCSRECQVEDWTKGSPAHKSQCGNKWRCVPVSSESSNSRVEAQHVTEALDCGVSMMHCLLGDWVVPYCIDDETGERFHGLTDQPFYSEE